MPLQWSSFWIKPSLITSLGCKKKHTILNHATTPMSAPHLWSVGCTTLHWQRPLAVQALHNTYALASHIGSGSMITVSSFQVVLWKYRHFRKHKKGSSKRQNFPNLTNLPANCMTPPCCSQLRPLFPTWLLHRHFHRWLVHWQHPHLPWSKVTKKSRQEVTEGHERSLCVSHHLGLRSLKMNPHLSESDPWLEGVPPQSFRDRLIILKVVDIERQNDYHES